MNRKNEVLAVARSDQVSLAFELKKKGRTVKEIAEAVGVSTRSIFKWFSKGQAVELDIDVPQSFDEAVAMLSDVTANEIAVSMSVSKAGRGASDRVYRLAKTLMMIRILASHKEDEKPEKTSEEMAQLRTLLSKRIHTIRKE